jgi:hypothetical protein
VLHHPRRIIIMTELTRGRVEKLSVETLLAVQRVSTALLAAFKEAAHAAPAVLSRAALVDLALGQDQCEIIVRNVVELRRAASLWWERNEVRGREV